MARERDDVWRDGRTWTRKTDKIRVFRNERSRPVDDAEFERPRQHYLVRIHANDHEFGPGSPGAGGPRDGPSDQAGADDRELQRHPINRGRALRQVL
jgi:hypothetical protein